MMLCCDFDLSHYYSVLTIIILACHYFDFGISQVPLEFCVIISNTKKIVSLDIQKTRNEVKKRGVVEFFDQLQSLWINCVMYILCYVLTINNYSSLPLF